MKWEPRYPWPERPGVFRISQSSLETYLRCGLLYDFRREESHRRATVAQIIGTAVAKAARVDCTSKIQTGDPAPARDLVEVAEETYLEETSSTEIDASKLEIEAGRHDTVTAADVYVGRVSPAIVDVVETERPIMAEVLPDLELVGTPDAITRTSLRDLKTGQPWSQDRVDVSRQLTSYDLLHVARFGHPARLVIDSLARRGHRWGYESFYTRRSEAQREAFRETLRRARDGIMAGVALPAPERAWWCSVKWCPYARQCPAFPGRRDHG